MFEKYKQKRIIQDEIVKKLIVKLEETNNWIKEPEAEYRYKDTDLIVKWGITHGYKTTHIYRKIVSPERMKIPSRFRKHVRELIEKIDNRDNHGDRLSFLNDYLAGEYECKLTFNTDKKSEMSIWLQEEGIFDYYIKDEIIWFKKESDAVAFKLRWTE